MDTVNEIYSQGYFQNPAFREIDHGAYFGYLDYWQDWGNIQRQANRVLERIEDHRPVGRILDVGCGPALFVDVAAGRGWDATGIDINKSAIEWAQANVTKNVSYGTVADIGAPPESFDCVTMFDVIEHLADPRIEINEVWRVLRPGGLLAVVTPDAGALIPRLLGARWLELKRAPEHLQFFSVSGLSSLLSLAGFHPIEWHSIGKITSVRTLLADMRFYSTGVVNVAEKVLDRVGVADTVLDADPRVKLCMYARKTGEDPVPLNAVRSRNPTTVPRAARKGLGQVGLRRFEAVSPVAEDRVTENRSQHHSATTKFTVRQRQYWENKKRFLDPRSVGPSAFATPKLDWIEESLRIDGASSVLDVGAGNGTLTWHLAQRAGFVVGLDFSRNLLDRSPCVNPMIRADATELPFGRETFDIVIESNLLHHVPSPVDVLLEMGRVARHHVVLIEANRRHLPLAVFMASRRAEWGGLRFNREYLSRLAELAGLRVMAISAQGGVYPNHTPAFLATRMGRLDKPGTYGAYLVSVLAKP